MTTIVTRITNPTGGTAKGSPLTSVEIDQNFINLNDNKIETADAVSTNTASKVVRRDASGNFTAGTITANLTGGTVSGLSAAITTANGGTGQTTFGIGEILIGNSGGTLSKNTIGGTVNQITVTSTSGSIGLSLPQDINTTSNTRFGSLGVGTTAPGVSGQLRTTSDIWTTGGGIGVGTTATGTAGEIVATNNITAYYSDDRLKTRLGKIENALDKVCTLEGFYYEANETAQALGYEAKREVGLSAQSTQAIMPEIVAPAPIDNQYLTIRYEKFAPLLVEAIKELRKEIEDIKSILKEGK